MILVLGGIASGKRTYLRSLGYSASDMSCDAADDRPVFLDAQELIEGEDADVAAIADEIARMKQAVAIVEVGSGVIPAERRERAWRDLVGAFARELANRSDAVVRMVCGIPIVLKGDPPQGGGACSL